MSMFKKYLEIINESNNYNIKNFLNSETFKELNQNILDEIFKEMAGKTKKILKIFKVNFEYAEIIRKIIKEQNKKNNLLKLFENKFKKNIEKNKKVVDNIINHFNIRDIIFDDITPGQSPNSFKLEISFNSDGYEEQGRLKIKGGIGEKEYRGKHRYPSPDIYTGPGSTNPNYRSQPTSLDKIGSKRISTPKNSGYSREQALRSLRSDAQEKVRNSGSFNAPSGKEISAKKELNRINNLLKK